VKLRVMKGQAIAAFVTIEDFSVLEKLREDEE
jgi:hypothetical protein